MDFYTDVRTRGSYVLVRGVKSGKRIMERVKYSPSLYIPTNTKTEFKNIYGNYLEKKDFKSIGEAKDWIDQFKGLDDFEYCGNTQWNYSYISDNYKDDIKFDLSLLRRATIDIETDSENGFPEPLHANERITAITCIINSGVSRTWGYGDYTPNKDEIYVKCVDEIELLKKFVSLMYS